MNDKIQSDTGLCTSIKNTDAENASVIKFIIDQFLERKALEVAFRTSDKWQVIDDLPMNFTDYRYRICR